MATVTPPPGPLTLEAKTGTCKVHTYYLAFCAARNPSWWMRKFLKPDFQHVVVLQPITHEFLVDGKTSWLENCFAVEYAGYAIMQQYYRWIDTPFDHLPASAVAKVWAEKGWKVIKIEREINPDKKLYPLCNPLVTCVTLAKCLMGVSCWAQTPYQLYCWALANGGNKILGD